MKKIVLIKFLIFYSLLSYAQPTCEVLKVTLTKKSEQRVLIKKEVSEKKKKQLEAEYNKLSDKAVEEVRNCLRETQPMAQSLSALQLNYLYGKLLLEKGQLSDAHQSFRFCLQHPLCTSARVRPDNPKTYSHYINSYIDTYIIPRTKKQNETPPSRVVYVEYSGKGGSFMKSLFDEVDGVIFDDSPLDADEMESIAAKSVYEDQEINGDLAYELSGSREYYKTGSFLLLSSGGMSQEHRGIKVESPDDPTEVVNSGKTSSMEFFGSLITTHKTLFTELYFDQYDAQGKLIPVYLFEGGADESSLRNFLEMSDKMHHRAHKGVAYYQPLDNSIVVWTASGNGTVIHELVHALMANDFKEAPLWLNEGLASLYEEINEGKPENNHRLVWIHQYLLQMKACLRWNQLMSIEAEVSNSETENNLKNAFSRYFCKFILDTYGQEKLSEIYKTLRNEKLNDSLLQEKFICKALGKNADEIQQLWQVYLLNSQLPDRWKDLAATYAFDIREMGLLSIKTDAIVGYENEFEKLKAQYEKKTENGTTPSNSPGRMEIPNQRK